MTEKDLKRYEKGVELKRAINEHEEEVRKLAEILQDKDNIKGYDTMYIQGEDEYRVPVVVPQGKRREILMILYDFHCKMILRKNDEFDKL